MTQQPTEGTVHVTIPSDLQEAQQLQIRIASRLKGTAFDHREIFGITLALEEALVNAIKHGNRMDRRKMVEVEFQVDHDRFEIRISDEGPGFDPEGVPDCQADENLARAGGRGLLLMRHYMTEVVVHPPGNRLSMMKVHRNGHTVNLAARDV